MTKMPCRSSAPFAVPAAHAFSGAVAPPLAVGYVLAIVALLASACTPDSPVQPLPGVDTVQSDTGAEIPETVGETTPDSSTLPDGSDASAPVDALADADGNSDATGGADADTDPSDDGVAVEVEVTDDVQAVDVPDVKPEVTVDAGPVKKSTHPTPCTQTADCQIPCASGTCETGKCKFTPLGNSCVVDLGGGQVGCFGVGDSNDKTPCLACAPAVSKTSLSSVTTVVPLDDEKDGVVFADTAGGGIGWNFNEKRSITGGNALYFGNPAIFLYANDKKVGGIAKLPPIAIPNHPGVKPKLAFWLWLATQEDPGQDILSVLVDDKSIWDSEILGGSTKGNWQRIVVDASAHAGKSVNVAFKFETKDSFNNAFEGAWIDNVTVSTGCCGAAVECEDGNGCSIDTCAPAAGGSLPVCSHTLKQACCNTNAECDDKVACTLDLCSGPGGTCASSPKPNCCLVSADCNDKDDCTVDVCPAPGGQCQYANTCCKSAAECVCSDLTDKASCFSGVCDCEKTSCSVDDDCEGKDACTQVTCDKGKCVKTSSTAPGCCTQNVATYAFAGNNQGWEFSAAQAGNSWFYKDTPTAKSAPGVLKYGDPTKDSMNLLANSKVKVTASMPVTSLISGKEASMTFQTWAQVSSTLPVLRVYTVVDGVEVSLLQTTNYGSSLWKEWLIDLTPLAGKSFQLVFEVVHNPFSTITGIGLLVDDVKVTSTCEVKKCSTASQCPVTGNGTSGFTCLAGGCADGACTYSNSCCKANSECDDKSLCTADSCVGGKCQFKTIPNCCMGNGDCIDNNNCTLDSCAGPGGQCAFNTIGGCCLSSTSCNDNVACTNDVCVANKCINTNTCCAADKDCDDKDNVCTTEKCVSTKCVFTQTNAPGCCQPLAWSNDFDGGDAKGMTFANSAGPTKGWQVWTQASESKSGKGVLYYGDPAAGNFDFSSSSGSAKSAKILLPATQPSSVQFWLFMDTEQGPPYDVLDVAIWADNVSKPVWNKNTSGYKVGSWKQITIDLALYAGKEVQVEFKFNTIDSVANNGKGVFVDDLNIVTKCN